MSCPGPHLVLYIDGVLKGETIGSSNCTACEGWTQGTGQSCTKKPFASYGLASTDQNGPPLGEPNQDWPGGEAAIGSTLRWFKLGVFPVCASGLGDMRLSGNWSTGDGQAVCCKQCPDALGPQRISVGARTSNASCVCNVGYTGPSGEGSCTACAMGTYKPVAGNDTCTSCDYGRYTLAQGSLICTDPVCKVCPPGAISVQASAGLWDCTCKSGFFGNASTGKACSVCPHNSYSPLAAASQADCTCNTGYYGTPAHNVMCEACPANSVPLASMPHARYIQNCTCNAGYFGRPTRFSNPPCQECPVNTYNPWNGIGNSSGCLACPFNSTTSMHVARPGRGGCMCDKGFFGNLGVGAVCEQCPLTTFGRTQGAISEGFGCTLCPPNSAVLAGAAAVSMEDCKCNAGYWGVISANNPNCNACANNGNCTLFTNSRARA